MVEEQSMEELLGVLLPRLLPNNVSALIIPHTGKDDLQKSIPKKLRAWKSQSDKFIIVHDRDSSNCVKLKNDIRLLCRNSKNDCLIRIVCGELESWYLGDLNAVSRAYGKDYTPLSAKRKYREPDNLANAKDELRKLIPAYQPISGTKKIAGYMDIDNNTSHSFNVFVDGVRMMCRA